MCPRGDRRCRIHNPPRTSVHHRARIIGPYNAKGDADDPQDAQDLKEPLRCCPVRGGALSALLAACSRSAPTAAAKPTVSPDPPPDLPEIVITASRSHNAPARPDPKAARIRSRATDKSS